MTTSPYRQGYAVNHTFVQPSNLSTPNPKASGSNSVPQYGDIDTLQAIFEEPGTFSTPMKPWAKSSEGHGLDGEPAKIEEAFSTPCKPSNQSSAIFFSSPAWHQTPGGQTDVDGLDSMGLMGAGGASPAFSGIAGMPISGYPLTMSPYLSMNSAFKFSPRFTPNLSKGSPGFNAAKCSPSILSSNQKLGSAKRKRNSSAPTTKDEYLTETDLYMSASQLNKPGSSKPENQEEKPFLTVTEPPEKRARVANTSFAAPLARSSASKSLQKNNQSSFSPSNMLVCSPFSSPSINTFPHTQSPGTPLAHYAMLNRGSLVRIDHLKEDSWIP